MPSKDRVFWKMKVFKFLQCETINNSLNLATGMPMAGSTSHHHRHHHHQRPHHFHQSSSLDPLASPTTHVRVECTHTQKVI